MAGAMLGRETAHGQDRDPPDKRLVLLGLNALARAHEMDYFADGHRGAAMVSAHLLCVDNHLDQQATSRIAELFDLNWASSKLCQPFPEADPDPEGIEKIGVALAEGGNVLRQVGHNVIFAMLAIKAFRMMPEAATPQRIDGVCALVRSFTPWREHRAGCRCRSAAVYGRSCGLEVHPQGSRRGDRSIHRVWTRIRWAHADLRPVAG